MDLNTATTIQLSNLNISRWVGQNGDVLWQQPAEIPEWLPSSLIQLGEYGKKSGLTSGGIWVDGAYQEQAIWNGYWQVLEDLPDHSDYFSFYKVVNDVYYGMRGTTQIQTLATHQVVQPIIGFSKWQQTPPYGTYIQSYSDHVSNPLNVWYTKATSGRYLDWFVNYYWEDGFDPDTGMPIQHQQLIADGRMNFRYYNPYEA